MSETLAWQTKEKWLGILCVIMVLGILVATLWPGNFFPANRVSWLAGENGIRFGRRGVVMSEGKLEIGGGDAAAGCTVEIWVRPASIAAVYTILNIYAPGNPRQFVVRQWTDGLLVSREGLDAQGRMKRTKFDVDHTFQPGQLVLLTMTSGANGTVVYKNGSKAQSFPRFRIAQGDLSGKMLLGGSTTDYEPWPGEIRGLAIYGRELSGEEVYRRYSEEAQKGGWGESKLDGVVAQYGFGEGDGRVIHNAVAGGVNLEVPERFSIPEKAMLKAPLKEIEDSWNYVNDVLRNIAGFIPLGFLLAAYWGVRRARGQAIVFAIVGGGLLSFTIEVLQAYIPQRTSGVTDIITNTLGAAIGAMLTGLITVRVKTNEGRGLADGH